jgi:hypothetical protein
MTPLLPQTSKPVIFLSSEEFDVERVFPIRNLVDENYAHKEEFQRPASTFGFNSDNGAEYFSSISKGSSDVKLQTTKLDFGGFQEPESIAATMQSPPTPEPIADGFLAPPYPNIPPENLIRPLTLPPSSPPGDHRRISERSQMIPHIVGPPGVVPGIITGLEPTFYRCEDEPIHIPGAIQQFGALVALRYDEDRHLKVSIVSENTENILFYSPESLFALSSFVDILDRDCQNDFVARVNHALNHASDETLETNLDCFNMNLISTSSSPVHLWCAIHISQGTKDLIICEFETYTTPIFHLNGLHSPGGHPKVPTHTIANEVSPEERLKSVTSKSQPLRVLELARRRQNSVLGSMEVFNAMTQVQQQLAAATTVQNVLDTTVGLVSELTGFHRVMLYRFDAQKNGCVVTELVDPKASADLFRGK